VSGYEVTIATLRKASEAATSAGEQARTVDLAAALSGVPRGLRGSRSAQSATRLADVWRTEIKSWSESAIALGQNMAASAARYESSEQAAQQDLSVAGRDLKAH
jgi:hypothetical protein